MFCETRHLVSKPVLNQLLDFFDPINQVGVHQQLTLDNQRKFDSKVVGYHRWGEFRQEKAKELNNRLKIENSYHESMWKICRDEGFLM